VEEPVSTQEKELDQAYIRFLLKQVAINRRYSRIREMFSYDYMKATMKWFLESATLDLSFSVSSHMIHLCVHPAGRLTNFSSFSAAA
jgi:hypothetical protein